MTERFIGNNLDAWCEHFALSVLKDHLVELGAVTVADLLFIYEDADLLAQIREVSVKPLIFKRFENARHLTDVFGVSVIPEADSVSSDSSSATTTATSASSTDAVPLSVFSSGELIKLTNEENQLVLKVDKLQNHLERAHSIKNEYDVMIGGGKSRTLDEIRCNITRLQSLLDDYKRRYESSTKAREIEKAIQNKIKGISTVLANVDKLATLDLLILLDCTASMIPYMTKVKNDINGFVDNICGSMPNMKIRLCFVGYRDHDHNEKRFAIEPFTTDINKFKAKIAGEEAIGGTDVPEDVHGGLKVALDQKWELTNRILFHIGDAPCHGNKYHPGMSHDNFPDGHPSDQSIESLLRQFQSKNIVYYFGRLNSSTDTMIKEFNKAIGSEYIQSVNIDANTLMKKVTASVSATIKASISGTHTITSSGGRTTSGISDAIEVTLSKVEPVWDTLGDSSVSVFKMRFPTSLDALVAADDDLDVVEDFPDNAIFKIATNPFDKGAQRAAYKAREYNKNNNKDFPRIINPASFDSSVIKTSLSRSTDSSSREFYEKNLSSQRCAIMFAVEFSEQARAKGIPTIKYVDAAFGQIQNAPGRPYFFREGLVNGEFEKYNSNTGFVEEMPSAIGKVDHSAVQAFSHWTYERSGHQIMVTDCQGAYDAANKQFVLTDPAIQCKNVLRFDKTNMSEKGFDRFFQTHKCNECCKKLGLPVHV
jgi:hypothetical protein